METNVKRVFTQAYREQAVKLVIEQGLGVTQAARQLGINVKTYCNWLKLARQGKLGVVDESRLQPVGELQAEITRLRKELAQAIEDREILKKASAYFARHQR
jgi:transposase